MIMEETIFRMAESANELHSYGEYGEAILLLQCIDRLCDSNSLDMPDEGIELNVQLDEKFNTNVLAFSKLPAFIKSITRGAKK